MLLALLEKLARELDRRSIPYMVIGSQAVLVHGEPRTTENIDVTLGVDTDRLMDVQSLVTEAGWRVLVDAPAQFVARTRHRGRPLGVVAQSKARHWICSPLVE